MNFPSIQNFRRRIIAVLLVLLAISPTTGCGSASTQPTSNLPTTPMVIGSKTYQLEIAADDASREHGLMERDTLPSDHGMIFVFEKAEPQSFWMHHTRFPLDIIFAGADDKIVSIHTMKAYDESNTYSGGAAKYAIEINAGEADKDGVKAGDVVNIPAVVDAALKN